MADSDRFEVLCKIGQGSFGVISKVKRKSDGLILCRKEISYLKMSHKEKEQLQAELSILKELRHPNIVQYYEREHLKATQDLHMYMEYCGNGDLGQVIKDYKKRGEQAPEPFVWSIFSQIVTALFRCHNGVDAPEVGDNWFGLEKRLPPAEGQKFVIIHRDLKPENVFLDSENNVKLGDFGLSKIIRSHDFASTYVGTPYYMSPELAGNERYTSASDIWSLGCIIYELCTQEVPFNARSHLELFQKIRLGKFRPIPPVYSQELQKVISSCLQTNPNSRPTAAQLLDLPIVCVVRKQQEAVVLYKDLEQKSKEVDTQAQQIHNEIDAKLRREWEVKARLEIDKQVGLAKAQLVAEFEAAVASKAEQLFQSKMREIKESRRSSGRSSLSGKTAVDSSNASCDNMNPPLPEEPSASYLMSADLGANLGRLSLESDATVQPERRRRSARTPFTRAQTTIGVPTHPPVPSFDMQDCFSPVDVHMASPSPATLSSLNLSPRRDGTKDNGSNRLQGNIFAAAADPSKRWIPTNMSDSDASTIPDDDFHADVEDLSMQSPSRVQPKRKVSGATPTKARKPRPSLARERTAPVNCKRLTSAPSLFPLTATTANAALALPVAQVKPRPASAVPVIATSPTRKTAANNDSPTRLPPRAAKQLSLLPIDGSTSPTRKAVPGFRSKKGVADDGMAKTALRNQMGVHGRTLVELAQARAGGLDRDKLGLVPGLEGMKMGLQSPTREAPVWDPERDEMPSPFLARGRGTRAVMR